MFKLKKFQIEQDYVDFADSEQFVEPNVSYISATEDVKYTADRPAHDYSQDYFTIESCDQYGYIELNTSHAYYSLDGGNTWEQQSGSDGISISSGQKCMIKYDYNSTYGNLSINFYDTRFKVYGNILSIADSTNFRTMTSVQSSFSVNNFFINSNVVDAENLVLPITWDSSYSNMFYNCTSLITAPSILPATTLANYCYGEMFYGCTSLTTAPELPATTLTNQCYFKMFYGCNSLNYIKCLATDISATECTDYWVGSMGSGSGSGGGGVSPTGTFVKAANMNDWTYGGGGIPEGWTVVDAS